MPYIKPVERLWLDPIVEEMRKRVTEPGHLAYVLFKFFLKAVQPKFISFCIWVGAIILCVFEIYRRIIAKYENEKIRENGDVD